MTHSRIAKAIAVIALASASGFAGADTGTLTVTATVNAVCKFGAIPNLAFGIIDPSAVAANVTGSTTVEYRCTKGTVPTALTATAGPLAMVDPGVAGSTLPFSLTLPAANTLVGNGFGAAAQSTFTINGTILLADAQGAMAGNGYTKAVTLTITP
jgi:spore coat protein U-like protein